MAAQPSGVSTTPPFRPCRIYLFRTLSKVKALVYLKSKPKVRQPSSQERLQTSLSGYLCQEPLPACSPPIPIFFTPLTPPISPKKTQSKPLQALKDSSWGEGQKNACIQRGNKLLFYAYSSDLHFRCTSFNNPCTSRNFKKLYLIFSSTSIFNKYSHKVVYRIQTERKPIELILCICSISAPQSNM